MHSRTKRVVSVFLLSLVGFGVAVGGVMVGTKSPGKWEAGSFAQLNLGCLMAYQCKAGVAVLHGPDTVVVTTPSESSFGVCNTAGGDIEGCNVCSASPPTKPCEYWLEKK